MALLLLPQWATKQPAQPPQLARGNPITRGLIHAFLPTGGGQSLYDAVTGVYAGTPGCTITKVAGGGGIGAKYGDPLGDFTNEYLRVQVTTEVNAGGIFWYGRRQGSGPAVFRDTIGSGGWLVWDDGAGAFNARLNGTTASSVGSFPANTDVDFLLTGDTTAGNGAFYSNGGKTAAISQAWNGTLTTSVQWRTHCNPTFSQGIVATDYLWLFWDRLVSAAEYASLHINPWQVFDSPRRAWVNAVASDALWAQSCL